MQIHLLGSQVRHHLWLLWLLYELLTFKVYQVSLGQLEERMRPFTDRNTKALA